MTAIVDLSDLINLQSGGNNGNPENIFFHKVPRTLGAAVTTVIAGRACSLWRYDGMPAAGDIPLLAGQIPTKDTVGAINFTNPGGDREKHLIGASVAPVAGGVFLLYDRLYHKGGLSGTSTAVQSIQGSHPGSPAITRNTGGAGNMAFYEIYTQIGTSTPNLTMTYTNENGVESRTSTINIGGTNFREVSRLQRIPLQAGDTGIRSIRQIQLSVTTGTAGNFGITIGQPLAWIPVGAPGTMGWRDYTTGLPGIPVISPDACLSLMYIPAATTALELFGCIAMVEK